MSSAPDADLVVLCLAADEATRSAVAAAAASAGAGFLETDDISGALEMARSDQPELIVCEEHFAAELCPHLHDGGDLKLTHVLIIAEAGGVGPPAGVAGAAGCGLLTKPVHSADLAAAVGVGLRITELARDLKSSQQALFRAEKMASLGVMAGGIAHEFNNIFGAIVGYCELAMEHGDPGRTRKALRVTLESAERATAITKNLLGFARGQKTEMHGTDLAVCLGKVMELFGPSLRRRNISFTRQIESTDAVKGDSAQMQQVFFNLVQNAQHAMEAGGSLTVSIARGSGDDFVTVKVSDTGIGIPEKHLPRVFEPFFTTKGAYGGGAEQGTGLGLSVVHGIIEEHDGRISAESRVGQGTTVTFELPLWSEDEDSLAAEPTRAAGVPSTTAFPQHLRVLAVDDEKHILGVLKDMLETFQCQVDLAGSADEAVEKLTADRYDLLFTDIAMPKKTGWDLIAEIRGMGLYVPVVCITGSTGRRTFERAKREGALACIYKPFHMQEIRRILEDFQSRSSAEPIRLRLMTDLDPVAGEVLLRQILPRLARSKRNLCLDMRDVGHLRSYGVAFVMKLYAELKKGGRSLCLENVSENAFETLELAGVGHEALEGLVVRRQTYEGS